MYTHPLGRTGLLGGLLFVSGSLVGVATGNAAETTTPPPAKTTKSTAKQKKTKKISPPKPHRYIQKIQIDNRDEWAVPERKLSPRPSDSVTPVPHAEKKSDIPHTPDSIREHLARRVTVEWDSVSLADAARRIAELGNLNVILHPEVDAKKTVNLQATHMRLQKVLDWTTRLSGYAYEIVDGAVFIAPQNKLKGEQVMRVYQVSDLTTKKKNFYPPKTDDDEDEDEEKEEGQDRSIPVEKLVEKIISLPGVGR